MMNGRLIVLTAALALIGVPVLAPPAHASMQVEKESTELGRYWIVELEAEPTLEFRGGEIPVLGSGGDRAYRHFERTAPADDSGRRFDVRAAQVEDYAAHLDRERSAVLESAAGQLGRSLVPRHVYRHLLNGFSADLSEAEARLIAGLPGVRAVYRESVQYLHNDAGHIWLNAPLVWSGSGGVPNPNMGDGMIVGVVDSGINWESPFFSANPPGMSPIQNPRPGYLGLCGLPVVQCNDKLIGVYDFTDEGTSGKDPDDHGSHVASSAAGNRLSFTLSFGSGPSISFTASGVAPRGNIISYKACEEDPEDGRFRCPASMTSAALEQALSDQVEAVNYSIGSSNLPPPPPWTGFGQNQNSTSRIMLNLRAAGIVPVSSAGNLGPQPESVSFPANAPWVLSVANATHDRILANRLVQTSGGPFHLGNLNGEGISDGTTVRSIVHARDFGNALCGTGQPELQSSCSGNTGASNPFPPGTFNGQIVVCDRGIYGRVEKGRNLQLAGAGGYILANSGEFGESTNADQHCLPATHVGKQDGDRLREWLDSGSGHSGRLQGTSRFTDPALGGRLATGSSRGPAFGAPNVMKPNVTGPGTNILGAGSSGENAIAFLSGTSMASPHIAGAALLLRKSHPSWGPDHVISALETTAVAERVSRDDGSPARIIDSGAGGPLLDRAARIGLYLPVGQQEFVNANPSLGGSPGSLNLPGVQANNCFNECSFTRRVRALQNGTWAVSTEGDLDIQVSPSSFTLSTGASQFLDITIRPGETAPGTWGRGSVVLSGPSGTSVQRLPVGAFISAGSIPGDKNIFAGNNRGRDTLQFNNLIALDEAVFRTSALTRPDREVAQLTQDPSTNDPYNFSGGTRFYLVDVPEDTLMLFAETVASSANDIDLFVGRDDNGNGQPDPTEERCRGVTPDQFERCIVKNPEAGVWWVLIQNWEASSPGATDSVDLDIAVLTASEDPSFVATGPGRHEGGPLSLKLAWDQPAMQRTHRWIGAVGVASRPDFLANVGVVPVYITRNVIKQPQQKGLFIDETLPVVLGPNVAHERLYFDVPFNVDELTIQVQAPSGVTGSLRRLDFADLAGHEPGTPPAPSGVVATPQAVSGGFQLQVSSGTSPGGIPQGRYYIRLHNNTGSEVLTRVSATYGELPAFKPQRGLWSPAFDLIFQGFEWQQVADLGFITWYTYDDDGVPAWYQTPGSPVTAGSAYWRAPLYRYTSNRERQTFDGVGVLQLITLDTNTTVFSWRFDGEHGSWVMDPDHGVGCPTLDGETLDLLGHWFPPGVTEGGATALFTAEVQAWIRYYYDQHGNPRWLQLAGEGAGLDTAAAPEDEDLEVLDFRGYCPYCSPVEVDFEVVGTVNRQIFSETAGFETIEFVARPPLNTEYATEREITRLSEVLACSPPGNPPPP